MIHIAHLKKTFRRQRVLDDLNLEIHAGERIALIGANGAGKTTLIRCLLGEYTYQGDISINGVNSRQRETLLKNTGFVPQLPPPLKMSVWQLLHFAAALCGSKYERMLAVAQKLGLDVAQFKHKPFVALSGGQKQKLLIAIALGRDSNMLILDEPAANLDPAARRIFFELLAQCPPTTIMLISSHRLDEVAPLVNRVLELEQGKVILDDHVADNVNLSSLMQCEIILNRHEEAFSANLQHWQFEQNAPLHWHGNVAGADKLRFLGMISRYTSLIRALHWQEIPPQMETPP
jgi:ABC-2 type transport system ATP-binding protein